MSPRSGSRTHIPTRTSASSGSPQTAASAGERLQKVLAAAGVGSRRQCEELILAGRVEVDRQVVTELGTRVDPMRQKIHLDGDPLPRRKRVYYLVNKPAGVLSTHRDPAGRTRVVDLIDSDQRLFTVGRLDKSSEGLILVTNDGELANRLAHPRYGITKTYQVMVAGCPTVEELAKLRKGIRVAEGRFRLVQLRVRRRHKRGTLLEIVLSEGRNREIRRMLARVGHKVVQLKRIAMGPLRLGELPTGAYRSLTPKEIRSLEQAGVGGEATPRRGHSKSRPTQKPRQRRPAEKPRKSRPTDTPRKRTLADTPRKRRQRR